MNEPQFGNKIRHLLNQGAPLDASILARLRAAREAALARQKPEAAQGVTVGLQDQRTADGRENAIDHLGPT